MGDDGNESLVLARAIERVVFGAPLRNCRLVEAVTRGDRSASSGAIIAPGSAYVTLTLATHQLARARIFTSQFRPVFYGQAAFSQDRYRPVKHSALITDAKDDDSEGPRQADRTGSNRSAGGPPSSAGLITGDRHLFPQTPYRGGVDVQFNLLACRSEEILKSLLQVENDLRKTVARASRPVDDDPSDNGDGDASHAAGKLLTRALAPELLAVDVASAAARAFVSLDGRWNPRLEYARRISDLREGHYVLISTRNESETLPDLEYDPDRRILYAGGKPVANRDFAVIRIDVSTRRENIEEIPRLGEAFEAIDLTFASGGDTTKSLNQFQRIALTCPHLIDADRTELIQLVSSKVEMLNRTIQSRHDGNESLLDNFIVRTGLKTLKALWDASRDGKLKTLEREPQAQRPAEPEPAPPEPLEIREPDTRPHSRFERALAFTLRWEGGFSDHQSDRGGRTMRGVTEAVYHAWLADQGEGPRPVERISQAEMHAIFHTNYWLAARCNAFSPPIDLIQFDAAVNSGPGGAARILQRAINRALGPAGAAHHVRVDGMVGPRTLSVASSIPAELLCSSLLEERRANYRRIAESNKTQNAFLKGWMNRVADLERTVRDFSNESLGDEEAAIIPENTAFAGYVD